MGICTIEIRRGDVVESRHEVHVAVVHADRGLIAGAGDPQHVSFVRSAIKMFQVLPFVEAGGLDRFGITDQELALCAASHGGEPFHIVAARSILERAGKTEDALACGPHFPLHAPTADAMKVNRQTPTRIHNNCSGKHAGMVASTVQQGWPTDGYHHRDHPLQQEILNTLSRWMTIDPTQIEQAIDGCGLPTFAIPLVAVARGCARFSTAAASEPAPARIFSAMVSHPEYVAGTGRLDTDLMRSSSEKLFVKVGAEGYYCAGIPTMRLGVALKVTDGATRAAEAALVAVLHAVDAVDRVQLDSLSQFAVSPILNTRGETVGAIRACVEL